MHRALGLAVGMVIAAAAAHASAQDKQVNLRFAHWLPPQHILHQGFQMWAKDVEEASKGTIKVQIFPAQQLGQAKDHYDMARDGIADITWVNPGYQPGRFPVIAAPELPFLLTDAKGGSAAVDAWYRKYVASEMGDVKFCMAHLHAPGTFHAKSKITKPEDIRGMKVRPAHGTLGRLVAHLGGTNVQVSAPESREALERGVADAITFPWDSILLFGIDKATKFHMDVPLYVTVFTWVMNQRSYDGLSAAQKQVIDARCNSEWAEKVATPWADREMEGRDKIRKLTDHTVYELSPAELDAWKTATQVLTKEWGDDVAKKGLNPEAVLSELKAEAAKRNAAF